VLNKQSIHIVRQFEQVLVVLIVKPRFCAEMSNRQHSPADGIIALVQDLLPATCILIRGLIAIVQSFSCRIAASDGAARVLTHRLNAWSEISIRRCLSNHPMRWQILA
jgi:hypothetical protein